MVVFARAGQIPTEEGETVAVLLDAGVSAIHFATFIDWHFHAGDTFPSSVYVELGERAAICLLLNIRFQVLLEFMRKGI